MDAPPPPASTAGSARSAGSHLTTTSLSSMFPPPPPPSAAASAPGPRPPPTAGRGPRPGFVEPTPTLADAAKADRLLQAISPPWALHHLVITAGLRKQSGLPVPQDTRYCVDDPAAPEPPAWAALLPLEVRVAATRQGALLESWDHDDGLWALMAEPAVAAVSGFGLSHAGLGLNSDGSGMTALPSATAVQSLPSFKVAAQAPTLRAAMTRASMEGDDAERHDEEAARLAAVLRCPSELPSVYGRRKVLAQAAAALGRAVLPPAFAARGGPKPHLSREALLPVDTTLLGKDSARCRIVCDHPSISRLHAVLTVGHRDGATVLLTDLGSANGTFVRDDGDDRGRFHRLEPFAPTPLPSSAIVRLGASTRTYTVTYDTLAERAASRSAAAPVQVSFDRDQAAGQAGGKRPRSEDRDDARSAVSYSALDGEAEDASHAGDDALSGLPLAQLEARLRRIDAAIAAEGGRGTARVRALHDDAVAVQRWIERRRMSSRTSSTAAVEVEEVIE